MKDFTVYRFISPFVKADLKKIYVISLYFVINEIYMKEHYDREKNLLRNFDRFIRFLNPLLRKRGFWYAVYMCVYMYVCQYVCMHVCIYACLYEWMYVCMYVCMNVYIC
jgi:hypothetical protein